MRPLLGALLIAPLLALATGCPGRAPSSGVLPLVDAGTLTDAGSEPGPDGGSGATVSCVDAPSDLPRPTTALPCELVPPGLSL